MSKKVVYRIGTVAFGMSHLVLQSMADACVIAEAKLAVKTGYCEPGDEKLYMKDARQRTVNIQDNVKEMSHDAWEKGLNYFKSKSLKHG